MGDATFNGQSVLAATTAVSFNASGHSINAHEIDYISQDSVTYDVYELAVIDMNGVMHTLVAPVLKTQEDADTNIIDSIHVRYRIIVFDGIGRISPSILSNYYD